MNKHNARQYIPHLEALADGELQIKDPDGGWRDSTSPDFTFSPSDYRRKPKPREFWVNVYPSNSPWAYESPESAARSLSDGGKTIRVREIIE